MPSGFAPGFAYLTGLDARLQLPRRATPRPRVPARSLAIAAQYTAVYPFDSPGGWHLIGSVDTEMFGLHGALLHQRRTLAARGLVSPGKRLGMALLSFVLRHRALYEAAGRLLRAALRWLPRAVVYGPWNVWGRRRELPPPPDESFRETWRRTRGAGGPGRG